MIINNKNLKNKSARPLRVLDGVYHLAAFLVQLLFLYISLWEGYVSFISLVIQVAIRQLLLELFDSSISCPS